MVPLHFNDGTAVPQELLQKTQMDLEDRFGAVSTEGQVIRGFDRDTGAAEDRLVRYFTDVPDTPENFAFFPRREGAAEGKVSAGGDLDHHPRHRGGVTGLALLPYPL
jgi:hypothetical protein